jgi:hypothetical protein
MAKWRSGETGNPNGRPPGHSLQKRLRETVGEQFDQLVDTVLQAALAGDMSACNLLLTRLVPPLRPIQDPVIFKLEGNSLTDKAHSVLSAVSEGQLSASDGKLLLDGLAGVVRVQDGELTARQLELIRLALDADKKKAA